MKGSFFCELSPTLTSQQYAVKSPCSFYISDNGEGQFDIFGISSGGKQKRGSLERVVDEENNEEVGQGCLEGVFTEDGKEVEVEFQYSLFDLEIVLGSGEWTETAGGRIRQKYKVQIRSAELISEGGGFIDRMLEKYAELDESRAQLIRDLDTIEARVDEVENKEREVSDAVKEFISNQDELSESITRSEGLNESLSSLIGDADKLKGEISKLSEENSTVTQGLFETSAQAERVISEADVAKDKANDALSSAITVSIARSFKERKKEAMRQRWIYDSLFVVSLIAGIVTTYNVFDYFLPNGGGVVANIEAFISKLPFLIFFVWLGLFASKKSSSASRIEEFYAQKQALAESYEGYKNEIMEHVESSEELAQLMAINLLSINKDSSQIFDGVDKEKHSPMHEMLDNAVNKMFSKSRMKPDSNSLAQDNPEQKSGD